VKIFKKTIFTIFTVFIVLLLAYNIYNFVCIRILKKDISTVGGYGMLEVVSGSMEPTIKVGDIIVIDVEDKDYKIGDIITFSKDNSFVTHRIISLDGDYLTTKGDNINNTEDDPISLNQILKNRHYNSFCFQKIIVKQPELPFHTDNILISENVSNYKIRYNFEDCLNF